MQKWASLIVLCLAFIVSIGFNIIQAGQNKDLMWWVKYFDTERREFSVGHGLLTNGTFFGDTKESLVSMQVQFICNPQILNKYDLIAVARVWDGMNIGRARVEKIRTDENTTNFTKEEKHQIRIRSYQIDILPLVKNDVQSRCGKKDETTYTAVQEFILDAVYNNIGYVVFE